MSVCFVVVPLVAGSWPMVSAAIVAAGAALGYGAVAGAEAATEELLRQRIQLGSGDRTVKLVMTDSRVVEETLQRGESFVLHKGTLRAEFHVDGRGACQVHVSGEGLSEAELEAAGLELMDRVRQQFAYAKLMEELESRGFVIQGQTVDESGSIRIRVQRM